MKVRGQEVLIPTSMVGNYPNPRWWDAEFARDFTGDQEPPDALMREALEDVVAAIARDQENAGLDIIADGRVHGDNYADQAVYYYYRRLGYNLKGGYPRLSHLQPPARRDLGPRSQTARGHHGGTGAGTQASDP